MTPIQSHKQSSCLAGIIAKMGRGWFWTIAFFLVFLLGVSVGVTRSHDVTASKQTRPLSNSTIAILTNLSEPVEIGFIVPQENVLQDDKTRRFINHVTVLLDNFRLQAKGRLEVLKFIPPADAPNTASQLPPDKQSPQKLSLTLSRHGKQFKVLELNSDWDSAMEADVARALAEAPITPVQVPPENLLDPTAVEAVKRTFTNLDNVSVSTGKRILRGTALEDFKKAARDLEVELKQDEQAVLEAQQQGDANATQLAQKKLEQTRTRQLEALKEIAARAKAQTEALEQMKQKPK